MIASKLTYILLSVAALILVGANWLPWLKTTAIALDVVLLVLLVVDYQLTLDKKFISATRTVGDRLSIGRNNLVELQIFNQGATNILCKVKDDFPPTVDSDTQEFDFELPANGMSALQYQLNPKRRGSYDFGLIHIRYRSFLKLFWLETKIPAQQRVKVFSDLKKLHELSIKLSHSSELGELHQRRRGQGTDFATLKEYTVGDDSKSIDWKATARRDRPVVRTYEAEQEQRLLILIDAGRMMASDLEGLTRFDHALNAALCLAQTGLTHNDQVGFGVFADKPLMYLPPRRGKSHLKSILEASFDVEPRLIEPDYAGMLSYFATAQKGRSLIVVLSDLTDPTGSQALLTGLASLGKRHLPFCVTLKDRQVSEIANSMVSIPSATTSGVSDVDMEKAYKRAIAIDLLAQRELALSVLQRRGCMILDCPPQELSDRLIDSYIEIKTRARL
ncbi:MAG TPA: DUF58 domain-containing protein [Drouetiella sp.]